MSRTLSFAKYCLIAVAAGACAVAIALGAAGRETLESVPAANGASGHLDCARIFPDRVLEPDLTAECSVFAARTSRHFEA